MKRSLIAYMVAIVTIPIYGQSNEANLPSDSSCCEPPTNYKSVKPTREEGVNYTLFEEELQYTVYFQNTTADTAKHLVIRDTIDENLDITTFRPLNGSHQFVTLINIPKHFVEFTFENIALPGKAIDGELSKGFVAYSIRPLKGAPENTLVENRADIYFDNRSPVHTNVTINTLVSQLPPITSTRQRTLEGVEVKTYPNPFVDQLNFSLDLQKSEVLDFAIFDAAGRQIYYKTLSLKSGQSLFSISADLLQANGPYYYQIQNESGRITNLVLKSGD